MSNCEAEEVAKIAEKKELDRIAKEAKEAEDARLADSSGDEDFFAGITLNEEQKLQTLMHRQAFRKLQS